MTETLEALLEKAKNIRMTPDQQRQQRVSFAYGNANIENSLITRDMVAAADERISRDEAQSSIDSSE